MTRDEAVELQEFIEGMGGCESTTIRRRRTTWALTVRMVGTPPRTFTNHSAAFNAFCAGAEED
jgi:hypothetical protein